jgi:hypothetical protein
MNLRKSVFAFALLGLTTTGCVKRTITAFQDHPTSQVTALEVFKHSNYIFFQKFEHIFYSCTDQASQLVCKRLCGGATDLECPMASGNGNGYTTNVR